MIAEVLLDTNVLVYAYERSEPAKQQRASDLLNALLAKAVVKISTQVLAEFFVTITRKLSAPLALDMARERVQRYMLLCDVVDVTRATVLEAMRGACEYRLHYWDAQIWAAARLAGIGLVFSEDFNDGAVLDGVRFVNPFRPDFRIADWL
jgi:predicted nucleic acid-binding protein